MAKAAQRLAPDTCAASRRSASSSLLFSRTRCSAGWAARQMVSSNQPPVPSAWCAAREMPGLGRVRSRLRRRRARQGRVSSPSTTLDLVGQSARHDRGGHDHDSIRKKASRECRNGRPVIRNGLSEFPWHCPRYRHGLMIGIGSSANRAASWSRKGLDAAGNSTSPPDNVSAFCRRWS